MTRFQRIATDVVDSLLAHKQSSVLMALGVAVGVAVLSAVIVIAQGTEARVAALVARVGLDMIMVRAGGEVQVFAPTADRGLTVLVGEDARAIEAEVPNVTTVSGVQNQRGINVVYEDRSVTTRAFGVESDWMEIRRWDMGEGEFISEGDLASMSRVVMMGVKVARALFPEGGAVGRTVRVANDPYVVKGVFVPLGVDLGGDDWDDRIVVPLTTSSRRLFNRPYLEQIVLRTEDPRQVPETAARIRDLLRVRHSIAAGEPDDFFVREPEDVENASLETSSTLSTLSFAVAIVALIAGGLVIMNVMVSAVAQRRHEIGVRRAMGARASDIQRQFLLEAVFVALAGGIVGVAAGIAIASGLAAAQIVDSQVTWVPFVVALVSCAAIGLLFGIQPARKAARVEPATTLRQQAG